MGVKRISYNVTTMVTLNDCRSSNLFDPFVAMQALLEARQFFHGINRIYPYVMFRLLFGCSAFHYKLLQVGVKFLYDYCIYSGIKYSGLTISTYSDLLKGVHLFYVYFLYVVFP